MSLSDFEIMKELGKGAFASVFKCKRIKDGNIYAMKRVNFWNMNSKERDNALNEIRILASVQHPNIIGYKESFYDEKTKTLNIIMDFADEGDLDSKVKTHQKNKTMFPETEIWSYLIQMLQGMKALHSAKIMHRDLKAANVFVQSGVLKLGDLNVSKLIKKQENKHTQTGTPYYASPEVWSDKPYDYKCDIWSVGCIIYELCCFKPPFTGKSLEDLFQNITKGIFPPIPNTYSNDLKMIIGIMLQVNPSLRPDVFKLLSNPLIIKRMDYTQLKENQSSEGTHMLNTIKMPKNIKDVNVVLPKKGYEIDLSKNEKGNERPISADIVKRKDPNLNYLNDQVKQINIDKKSDNNIIGKDKIISNNNQIINNNNNLNQNVNNINIINNKIGNNNLGVNNNNSNKNVIISNNNNNNINNNINVKIGVDRSSIDNNNLKSNENNVIKNNVNLKNDVKTNINNIQNNLNNREDYLKKYQNNQNNQNNLLNNNLNNQYNPYSKIGGNNNVNNNNQYSNIVKDPRIYRPNTPDNLRSNLNKNDYLMKDPNRYVPNNKISDNKKIIPKE